MIFKQLFQKAHTHPDANKRIAAIESLKPQQEKDRQILHELAFNDESTQVSLAALSALSSFTLWLKAYETHFNQQVQTQSKLKVVELIEDATQVNESLFLDIVKQHKHKQIVKEMIFASARLHSHAALCVDALLELCSEQEIRKFYVDIANEAQQIQIINAIKDEKTLKRFNKFDNPVNVSSLITDKLNELAEAAAKPPKIKAAASLVNSRLLALYELNDFEQITEQKQQLVKQFDHIKADFYCLSEDDATSISSKYLSIKEQVDRRLAQLEPQYKAQMHAKALNDSISDIDSRADTIASQVSLLSQSDSAEQLDSQVELLSRAIEDLKLELTDVQSNIETESNARLVKAHSDAVAKLNKRFENNLMLLSKLPEHIALNAEIDVLTEQAEKLLAPADIEATDSASDVTLESSTKTQEEAFIALAKKLDAIFANFDSAPRKKIWQNIKRQQAQHQKAHRDVKARNEKRCLNKLSACLNMVEQGRFKAAMATFNTARELYQTLATPSMTLVRRFEQAQTRVSELKDWQAYIATPRKPELIASAQSLSENKGIDIGQRAALVKQYRAEYNSLGRLHTPEDDALNNEFDATIEKAFAPCRAHFQEQDKRREENLNKAEQIIEALDALKNVEEPQVLAKHLSALGQQYRKLGELEKSARSKVHKAYLSKLKPLQNSVNAFYEANAEAKQKLVNKAQALAEVEQVDEAADTAKTLQSEWKNIGFAGAKQDQNLWQAFRKANDAVFERLKANIDAQKQEQDSQAKMINKELSALKGAIADAKLSADLADLEDKIAEINELISGLATHKQKPFYSKLDACKKAYADKIKTFQNQKSKAVTRAVFDALAKFSEPLAEDELDALPAKFKQAFEQVNKQASSFKFMQDWSRAELTIAADFIVGDGNNIAESDHKKSIQLKIMAAKLEGQDMPNADALLIEWISKGKLLDNELDDLKTLTSLYCIQ